MSGLISWLSARQLVDQLVGWLINQSRQLVKRLVDWLFVWQTSQLHGQLVDWLAG